MSKGKTDRDNQLEGVWYGEDKERWSCGKRGVMREDRERGTMREDRERDGHVGREVS